jgi:hypothetical protein
MYNELYPPEITTVFLDRVKYCITLCIDEKSFIKNTEFSFSEFHNEFERKLIKELDIFLFKTENSILKEEPESWFDHLLISQKWLTLFFGKPKMKKKEIKWEEIYNTVHFPSKNPLVKILKY